MAHTRTTRKLAPQFAKALENLCTDGLPRTLSVIEGATVRWEGVEHPIERLVVRSSGQLELDFFCDDHPLVDVSSAWKPGCLIANLQDGGLLHVDKAIARGIDYVERRRKVRIHGDAWRRSRADPMAPGVLWCAPLDFGLADEPHLLDLGADNLQLRNDVGSFKGWGFDTPQGFAALVRSSGQQWHLALSYEPSCETVLELATLIGFALGQPFAIGLFHKICADGVAELVRFPIADWRSRSPSRRAPALPAIHGGYWLTHFVERGLDLLKQNPLAPLLTAIHHSFEALDGMLDSEFLHCWIGAETLASWGMREGLLKNGGVLRIADHSAWEKWVRANEPAIKAHAVPGMEMKLVDRVLGSETTAQTPVQRAFRGEGIAWTPDLDELEHARNGVAHEGGMPGYLTRDWLKDVDKVGLALNVLTTIVAKLISYDGPISDRASKALSLSQDRMPAWWSATGSLELVTYSVD